MAELRQLVVEDLDRLGALPQQIFDEGLLAVLDRIVSVSYEFAEIPRILLITLKKAGLDRSARERIAGTTDINRHERFGGGSYPALAAVWRPSRRPAFKFSPIEPARISHIHMRIPGRRIPVR
jgi:hypothetical protein